jgi:dTDP-4-dehydrorhamnose 3,5-epimerase
MIQNHRTFEDERGSLTPLVLDGWEQVNITYNKFKYTFRGMHYQTNPPQTKYIKVVKGSIIDYLYNLETGELSEFKIDNQSSILVPNNYAHGFITLEDDTIISYLVKGEYNPSSQHSIVWSDIHELKLSIENTIGEFELIISEKDKLGK